MSPLPVLDLDQILDLYPRSFVLLDHCKFSPRRVLTHGHVVCSSRQSSEIYSAQKEHPNSLIIFTGPRSETSEDALLDCGETWQACHPVGRFPE